MTMLTLTSGTAFIMWLGEQITERGIGNGISLIIFAGIVASIPSAIVNTFRLMETGELNLLLMIFLMGLMLAVVAAIVFMEAGHRKIPIQYAKRVVGRRMYGGQSTHLPLKLNTAGVIPPIFASSIISFPLTIATFHSPSMAGIGLQCFGTCHRALYAGKRGYDLFLLLLLHCYYLQPHGCG